LWKTDKYEHAKKKKEKNEINLVVGKVNHASVAKNVVGAADRKSEVFHQFPTVSQKYLSASAPSCSMLPPFLLFFFCLFLLF
jgi:hypothetical protein